MWPITVHQPEVLTRPASRNELTSSPTVGIIHMITMTKTMSLTGQRSHSRPKKPRCSTSLVLRGVSATVVVIGSPPQPGTASH